MKNLKSIFKGENVEVFKLVNTRKCERVTYTIETYLDDMYICVPDGNYVLGRVMDYYELVKTVEGDSVNKYQFTKEAYERCLSQCSQIAL